MNKFQLLYLIIFLEGFVVLAVELLAIRLTIPFVGSGTDTISLIVAAVLMPLAFGYYRAGTISIKSPDTIRKKLQRNFIISMLFLSCGLSYALLEPLFTYVISDLGQKNRLILTALYSIVVLVTPVYLLGQTVPLTSNYFRNAHLPKITGKILFFSTLGSFLGATLTTIILLNLIGLHYTICVVLLILFILVLLVTSRKTKALAVCGFMILLAGVALNGPQMQAANDVVSSNSYNLVQVKEHEGKEPLRYLKLDGAYSASIFRDDPSKLPMIYAEYVENHFIRPAQRLGQDGQILILGAGGFTIGRNNLRNQITYVDIDPQLKKVAEEHLLEEPLGKNKTFISQPARSFLKNNAAQYDVILVDIGKGITGSPEHLVTKEFFASIKQHVKPGGIMVAHYYMSPLMDDAFSRGLHRTISAVYPHISRVVLGGYNPWADDYKAMNSVLYVFKNQPEGDEEHGIYTDSLNRSMWNRELNLQ